VNEIIVGSWTIGLLDVAVTPIEPRLGVKVTPDSIYAIGFPSLFSI